MRTTILATEKTSVEAAAADLRARCERGRLPPQDTAVIVEQTAAALHSFMKRAEELGSTGCRMHVVREFAGEGYLVKIRFDAGGRRTVLQKLMDVFRGRG